jgi:hypothetical protein
MPDEADIREIDAMIKINCAVPRKETMATSAHWMVALMQGIPVSPCR